MTNTARKYTTPRKEGSTSPRRASGTRDTVYTAYAQVGEGSSGYYRSEAKSQGSQSMPIDIPRLSEDGGGHRGSSCQVDDMSVGGMATLSESQDSESSDSVLERVPGGRVLDLQSLPPDQMLSQFNPLLRSFRLLIVQQPVRARMCGSSDKDWRPVSPPPVLKLELYDTEGHLVIDNRFMQHLVIHTTLWREDQSEELTVVELPHNTNSKRISAAAKCRKRGVTQFGYISIEPGREIENNLLGDYSASSSIVENVVGERGCYFVFPNLSIRLEGRYRLRFSLIKLPSMADDNAMFPVFVTSVFTDPFDVYSIKTFPGMIESTALSRTLAMQGLKIPIRNTQDLN
ncbi:hypothetical protein GGH93_002091 [Coemansia aciculifera]|nr:hypothetical protein GGH93_002091 [Coemansia aciculifera]